MDHTVFAVGYGMMFEAENLSHAYLIASDSEQERETMAAALAQKMICESASERPCGVCRHCRKVQAGIHPDIVIVERDRDEDGVYKREFQVGKMREMLADAWIRPNEAQKKVYIIRDAQTLNQSAQNAILKLLEEPPGGACFILCADNAAALLDTVRSRCVEWSGTASADTVEDAETAARIDAYLKTAAARDLPGLLKLLCGWEALDMESLRQLVRALRSRLAAALCLRAQDFGLSRRYLSALLELAEQAEDYLRANVGRKHILGLLSVRTIQAQEE